MGTNCTGQCNKTDVFDEFAIRGGDLARIGPGVRNALNGDVERIQRTTSAQMPLDDSVGNWSLLELELPHLDRVQEN